MVPSRAITALGHATGPARKRYARDTLIEGRPRRRDRVLGSLYWSLAARKWEEWGHDPDHLEAYAAGLERTREPDVVLDLGTGAGGSAALAARRYPGTSVIGVDTSRTMLARARRSYPLPNLEFRRASLWRLPFEDGSFGLVTTLNCFPELGELRRVTAAGAQVLMSTSYGRIEQRSRVYKQRWRDGGFDLVDAADAGKGTFELYARA